MLRLVAVTANYPSRAEPSRGTFVYSLVQELCAQGTSVSVIAPRSVYHAWRPGASAPSYGVERATVLRPRFLSFSNVRFSSRCSTMVWGTSAFARSVLRSVGQLDFVPDLVYGHFLFYAGAAAIRIGQRLKIPAVVAMGESDPVRTERALGIERMRRVAQGCAGILAVSRQIREYCITRLGVADDRVIVVPNATNARRFYPRSRTEMRKKLGLPPETTIVAFVGRFEERKGPLRLLAALDRIPNVGGVFLGEGPQRPIGGKVLFAGRVEHDRVPEWLSAADAMVLPTLAEGCSNAIAEALACGLPVIATDIPEVRDQVGDRAALLAPPNNISELEAAIRAVVESPERRRLMADAARRRAQAFTLEDRAKIILEWMESRCIPRKRGPRVPSANV